MISLVIPTYNEADNIPNLLCKIEQVLSDIEYEVLIVDDNSTDDTVGICAQLKKSYPLVLLQPGGRPRDLSLSVIDGCLASKFDRVVVLDADLSHPPDKIILMLAQLDNNPDCFILGSRYFEGGSFDRQWSCWRFLNSYVATAMARPLVRCTDPMSGFFMLEKSRIDLSVCKPIGYKIGLEFMVRGDFRRVIEVPIGFKDRQIGESKMDLGQQFKYLRHLRRLYLVKLGGFGEFIHFGAVGTSGFVLDLVSYYGLQFLGVPHTLARAISFWPAVSWNWALNRVLTFGERTKRPKTRQWLEFVGSSLVGFAVNFGVYQHLTAEVGFFQRYHIAAFIAGIGCASLFNFAASTLFVYSNKRG
ncbi:MAG: glycosyltransferase family 2 protein [Pseudomonadales bacterium]|nr:glycosyltransferase family 2 protein [Pseudomonadales bacterium]